VTNIVQNLTAKTLCIQGVPNTKKTGNLGALRVFAAKEALVFTQQHLWGDYPNLIISRMFHQNLVKPTASGVANAGHLLPANIIIHQPSKHLIKWVVDLPKTFQIVFTTRYFLTLCSTTTIITH
jgi:hypothetical protein